MENYIPRMPRSALKLMWTGKLVGVGGAGGVVGGSTMFFVTPNLS